MEIDSLEEIKKIINETASGPEDSSQKPLTFSPSKRSSRTFSFFKKDKKEDTNVVSDTDSVASDDVLSVTSDSSTKSDKEEKKRQKEIEKEEKKRQKEIEKEQEKQKKIEKKEEKKRQKALLKSSSSADLSNSTSSTGASNVDTTSSTATSNVDTTSSTGTSNTATSTTSSNTGTSTALSTNPTTSNSPLLFDSGMWVSNLDGTVVGDITPISSLVEKSSINVDVSGNLQIKNEGLYNVTLNYSNCLSTDLLDIDFTLNGKPVDSINVSKTSSFCGHLFTGCQLYTLMELKQNDLIGVVLNENACFQTDIKYSNLSLSITKLG